MLDFDRVKIIKEMVESVARRTLPPSELADLRITVPAAVIDAPGHVGVCLEGAKRFGEDDYVICASFTLSPLELADNDAVIKKVYLASEAVKGNVFIEFKSSARSRGADDGQDVVYRPKAWARI